MNQAEPRQTLFTDETCSLVESSAFTTEESSVDEPLTHRGRLRTDGRIGDAETYS